MQIRGVNEALVIVLRYMNIVSSLDDIVPCVNPPKQLWNVQFSLNLPVVLTQPCVISTRDLWLG